LSKEKVTREKGMSNAQWLSIIALIVGMASILVWSYFSGEFWSAAFLYLAVYFMAFSLVAAVQYWYYSPWRDAPFADE